MATVYVTMGSVGARAENDVAIVYRSGSLRSETITSSGTSAQGSLEAADKQIAQVFCDTAVYAKAGANPTAAAASSLYVPAGQPAYIAMQSGDKIAVIDV